MQENYPRILLVEDEPNFGSVLKDYLELNDYKVQLYPDGFLGREAFDKQKFDLVLLDVMLPKMDGFALGRYIRHKDNEIPLIYITAKSLKPDVVEGFKTGADDYITKPFDSEVLLYKIKAILKRHHEGPEKAEFEDNFKIGEYTFNSRLRSLEWKGEKQLLSPREGALLKMLCLHLNDVTPRSETLIKIWKEDNYFTTRSMDVFIARLRKYLKNDPNVEIANIHGNGFILRVSG
jgi:two-component system, OmpR family, response regulator